MAAPDAAEPRAQFTLGDRGPERPPEEAQEVRRRLREVQAHSAALGRRVDRLLAAWEHIKRAPGAGSADPLKSVGDLTPSLEENLRRLRTLFRAPDNADLIIRELEIGLDPPVAAAVVFMEGMSDKEIINTHILQPLMLLAHLDRRPVAGELRGAALVDHVVKHLLPGNQAETKPDMQSVVAGLLYGDTAVLLDGSDQIIMVETKGFPLRSVDTPQQEMVIRGPLDAFNESFRVNVALVRKRLKDPRLVTEMLHAGTVSRTFVAVMYLDGVANPKLVKEVKRRIDQVRLDVVTDSGILEQMIEDRTFGLFPQTLSTERPDRAAAFISEGHVAILVDNSPLALIVPVTWWSFMQSAEDFYIRWPYGTVLRGIRGVALFIALLGGGLYVAAVNFHHEMIPTQLMLYMAGSREPVPFPAVLELLLMEFAFELVREAGIRIPSVIGPTIGIVGALILGQAAVQARLFSPVVVIITAISGLASFTIPNYSSAYGLRALRLLFIVAGGMLGLYGIAAGLLTVLLHTAGMRSFGVPFLTPVAPNRRRAPDVLGRGPVYQMELRPRGLRPVDTRRQPEVARRWDPLVPEYLRRGRRKGRRDGNEGGGSAP